MRLSHLGIIHARLGAELPAEQNAFPGGICPLREIPLHLVHNMYVRYLYTAHNMYAVYRSQDEVVLAAIARTCRRPECHARSNSNTTRLLPGLQITLESRYRPAQAAQRNRLVSDLPRLRYR